MLCCENVSYNCVRNLTPSIFSSNYADASYEKCLICITPNCCWRKHKSFMTYLRIYFLLKDSQLYLSSLLFTVSL